MRSLIVFVIRIISLVALRSLNLVRGLERGVNAEWMSRGDVEV